MDACRPLAPRRSEQDTQSPDPTSVSIPINTENRKPSPDLAVAAESSQYDVFWDGDNDPKNPRNWGLVFKWAHIILLSFLTFVVYVARMLTIAKGPGRGRKPNANQGGSVHFLGLFRLP